MNRDTEQMTVRQVLQDCPQAEPIFQLFELSSDTESSLGEIAEQRCWPVEALLAALDTLGEEPTEDMEWQLHKAIIAFVRQHYHKTLGSELRHIDRALAEAMTTCPQEIERQLDRLGNTFGLLSRQLRVHVGVEEEFLFPEMCRRGHNGHPSERALAEMDQEHDLLNSCLQTIRDLTGEYSPPPSSPEPISTLYKDMETFDLKLQQHVAVEHDFLWPTRTRHQSTAVADTPPVSTAEHEGLLCPRTKKPCEEGLPNVCKKFWECVQNVIDERWDEAVRDQDPPNGSD